MLDLLEFSLISSPLVLAFDISNEKYSRPSEFFLLINNSDFVSILGIDSSLVGFNIVFKSFFLVTFARFIFCSDIVAILKLHSLLSSLLLFI